MESIGYAQVTERQRQALEPERTSTIRQPERYIAESRQQTSQLGLGSLNRGQKKNRVTSANTYEAPAGPPASTRTP